MSHTPGPWWTDGAAIFCPQYAGGQTSWGMSNGYFGLDPSDGMSDEMAEANAHLIAAAPELLAAGVQCSDALAAAFDEEEVTTETWFALYRASIALSRAITKAKGEAPENDTEKKLDKVGEGA